MWCTLLLSGISCEEGCFNSGKLWNLKKKLCPKVNDPPTALVDERGNIITSDEAIEELTLSTYTKRLENRPIKEGLESHKETSEKLFHLRMKKARSNKTIL